MSTIDLTDAVDAAARAQYDRATAAHPEALRWEDCAEADRAAYRTAVRPHVEAAAPLIAARSLQDAAAAFAATRPTESARRSLEYPAVELRAMAYRHTVQGPVHVPEPAPSRAAPEEQPAGAGARRRVRTVLGTVLGAVRSPRSAEAARTA